MPFIGNIIFNFVGGCVRYVYGTTWRTIFNKEKFTFDEYINGPKKSEDYFDQTGHRFVNGIIGMVTIVLICWILIEIRI